MAELGTNNAGANEALSGAVVEQAPVGTSTNPSNKILTLANFVTMARLVLTFVFFFLFIMGEDRRVALAVYIIASATDFLDGQIARRTQTVSWFGKQLDPIVDRALLFTGVLGLLLRGELPLWIPIFVIGRDIILAQGMHRLRKYQKRPMDVLYVGKAATALLMTGFCFMLLGIPVVKGLGIASVDWLPGLNDQQMPLGIFFVYVGVILSFLACVTYYDRGFAIKRQYLNEHSERGNLYDSVGAAEAFTNVAQRAEETVRREKGGD